ncbi:acyloxyacyl hydrolase [Billgrantia endophytica]|uniref:Acyloxyacyl hydrolase n=1 Tax=Billgrantia endophytica TaxID=2033802 RepID=A0A2N7U2V0_9GAMM|nr:acyloxyacyl hydrolase [Halomonas endophytica]PMR74764.1 acyloxyacyl hydrolase [Halomonas endophytica]
MAGVVALAGLTASFPSMADIYLAAGATSESTAALRIEVDRVIGLERVHPQLDLRLGTGLLLLSSGEEDGNAAWLLTPALRWTFAHARQVFVEGNIGAALFLNTRVEDRQLSTAFQFQDRLALGLPAGNGELTLSLTHYSNGGIKRPNDGFEILSLGYRWAL